MNISHGFYQPILMLDIVIRTREISWLEIFRK